MVTAPTVDAGTSSLTVEEAVGKSSTDVTVTLEDSAGNLVTAMTDQIALTATLTAGTQAGKYALVAKAASTAQTTVIREDTAADMAISSLATDKITLTANGTDTATLTMMLNAKDERGTAQSVSGEAARLSAVNAGGRPPPIRTRPSVAVISP